jgi:hypothetical protein
MNLRRNSENEIVRVNYQENIILIHTEIQTRQTSREFRINFAKQRHTLILHLTFHTFVIHIHANTNVLIFDDIIKANETRIIFIINNEFLFHFPHKPTPI